MIRLPWRRLLQPGSGRPSVDPNAANPGRSPDASAAEPGALRADAVRGERAGFIAGGARALQSRVTSLLAAGLMTSVGAAMLSWYYVEALSRPAAVHVPARAALTETAGEGMTLPPFGPTGLPPVSRLAASATPPSSTPATPGQGAPLGGPAAPAPALPLASLLEPSLDRAPGAMPHGYGAAARPSSRQTTLDRRLAGEVFAAAGRGPSSDLGTDETGIGSSPAVPVSRAAEEMPSKDVRGDALETLLRPSAMTMTRATILPTKRLLLPKGAFIDCTLETAIDSTLPGMTTCVTATDTFGADGTVVLLERGTKLIGETRGEVHQGDARVFVVWTEARTPTGVIVKLDSPGTDALGRSGLEGRVNRHFWQRFGAAALVSTIDGAVQSEVQSSSRGGTVVLDPTASEDVLTEILRGSVNIPPTIRVPNGARIQVLAARDVDFRPVYELEPR